MSAHKVAFVGFAVREKWGHQRGFLPRRHGVVLQTSYNGDALVEWPDEERFWYWQSELKRERR